MTDETHIGAVRTWRRLSHTQRRALAEAQLHGGRLELVGREYRHGARHQPYVPIHAATVSRLCQLELMGWERWGDPLDYDGAAVVTERGRFVLAHAPK